MAGKDRKRLLIPLVLWLISGAIALGLFIVWANEPDVLNENLSVSIGAIACLVSGIALAELIRRAISPRLLIASIGIHFLGLVISLVVAFVYAFFFSVFHAKDF